MGYAEAPFDIVGALARTPLFEGLDPTALAEVAGRMRAQDLPPGGTIAEGAGRLQG